MGKRAFFQEYNGFFKCSESDGSCIQYEKNSYLRMLWNDSGDKDFILCTLGPGDEVKTSQCVGNVSNINTAIKTARERCPELNDPEHVVNIILNKYSPNNLPSPIVISKIIEANKKSVATVDNDSKTVATVDNDSMVPEEVHRKGYYGVMVAFVLSAVAIYLHLMLVGVSSLALAGVGLTAMCMMNRKPYQVVASSTTPSLTSINDSDYNKALEMAREMNRDDLVKSIELEYKQLLTAGASESKIQDTMATSVEKMTKLRELSQLRNDSEVYAPTGLLANLDNEIAANESLLKTNTELEALKNATTIEKEIEND